MTHPLSSLNPPPPLRGCTYRPVSEEDRKRVYEAKILPFFLYQKDEKVKTRLFTGDKIKVLLVYG